ncbi:MAG: amino acid racemase [Paludibacterium sp.]|uniref:aspartate/glutamate racemase family protein n=1 Tax=Paludibacterium sp. TaxID=1917523 RepID=UPI0025ECDA95|nr:amino acid racemase [Paludibacterium sp.]MBV8048731.1 amino acid racemase [Paludibacterium sp.]MBV8648980.1 amino acid racemase [Paludibacterium sp.]
MGFKKIGIIGGLSPESTASYYLHMTRSFVRQFGSDGYPEIIIYSVNLEKYHQWRAINRWDLIAAEMIDIANKLLQAGADIGLIATNTMHKVFYQVQQGTRLPLLHILDATIAEIKKAGLSKVGVLGTQFTMGEHFYRDYLARHGISALVPCIEEQELVHSIIVNELVRGTFLTASKAKYLSVIQQLIGSGAEGIVLGCTEIPLLVDQQSCDIPLFDTAVLHAEAALQAAIADRVMG